MASGARVGTHPESRLEYRENVELLGFENLFSWSKGIGPDPPVNRSRSA